MIRLSITCAAKGPFLLATLRAFVDSNQPAFAIYECCIIQLKVTFVKKKTNAQAKAIH